jgi:SWI/SNF-related matrix-associated actin-dependent regulator of chromatin subfamily A containing DEAD/H box 1
LDILGTALDQHGIKWIRLDGSTRVDERQQLVDEFTEDESIKVFLLSTRAGGMGYVVMIRFSNLSAFIDVSSHCRINLVAACVVCIYDQDFNRELASEALRRFH